MRQPPAGHWDGGSCGLTGALAPWSERRGHSGRVRKAMPDRPPHGRAAVRHGGGLGARLKRRFVPPGEGEVGGWCERWRVDGLFADSRGGSAAYIASVRSPPLLRHLGRWPGSTHPQSAPPPGEGRVSSRVATHEYMYECFCVITFGGSLWLHRDIPSKLIRTRVVPALFCFGFVLPRGCIAIIVKPALLGTNVVFCKVCVCYESGS